MIKLKECLFHGAGKNIICNKHLIEYYFNQSELCLLANQNAYINFKIFTQYSSKTIKSKTIMAIIPFCINISFLLTFKKEISIWFFLIQILSNVSHIYLRDYLPDIYIYYFIRHFGNDSITLKCIIIYIYNSKYIWIPYKFHK